MNNWGWLISRLGVGTTCVSALLLLIACGSTDILTKNIETTYSSNNIEYVANVTIGETTTEAELLAETGGEIILFKPEAGFAVVGFDKPLNSLSTLAGDATENQDVFSQPEFASQAFNGSGHSSWAGGHSSWAGGWSSWAGGWSSWAGGHSSWAGGHSSWAGGTTIPALPKDNQAAWDLIGLEEAHMLSRNFGDGATVAVIDTGIDTNHPMFQGRLAPSSQWRDFLDNDNDPSEVSGAAYGHGTGVAGIILQIAPLATILPIRVLDQDGFGDTDDILLALDHAINMGVDVINLSLGTNVYVGGLANMIALAEDKGIYVTSSSGNAGPQSALLYPSRWINESSINTHQLNVGSLNMQGDLSNFTSDSIYGVMWGSEDKGQQWYRRLEQAAPGENIVSAYPGGLKASYTGTSFAAPMLAGALALAKGESSSTLTFSKYDGTYLSQPYQTEDFKAYTLDVAGTMKGQSGWTTPQRLNNTGSVRELNGTWTRSGGQSSNSKNNPKYSFSLDSDDFVAVDLNSSVDTYLYLLDSSGKVVAQNNNYGYGTNARIMKKLSKGSYTIVAATVKKSQKASFEVVAYGDVNNLN